MQCLYVPSALRFVPPLYAMLLRALRLFLNISKQRLFAVLQRRQHAHALKRALLPSATEVGVTGWGCRGYRTYFVFLISLALYFALLVEPAANVAAADAVKCWWSCAAERSE